MSFAKRALAEFGNDKDDAGGARVVVDIGDGLSPKGYARTINYTVDGSADRGDGKDYTIDGCTSSTCSVRLPANRHSAVITIYVNDDGLVEPDETIVFTLQDGDRYTVNNARKTTTVTIRDDDTRGLTFHRRWPDVPEGGSQTYTVKLKSQPTAAVTVKIASDNPDVTVDKSSLTFTTSNWKTTQTVRVSAAQDSDAVDDEATLTHTTSGGDYGGANALSIGRSVSVDDDDPRTTTVVPQLPRISLTGGAAVTEGAAASFTVNADRAPTARLTVNLEVVEPGGGDFVAASEEGVRTVTLNAGATSTTFTVPTVNDNTEEVDGAVLVLVNAGTGYSAGDGDLVNVNDNDGGGPPPTTPAASFASASSSAAENAGTRNVTVNLSSAAPSGGLTLGYSVTGTATAGSGNDFTIQNSGSLTVAAGDTSATIPVAINDDSSTESAETVILTLTGGAGYTLGSTRVHTLTITDNDGGTTPTTPVASFASGLSSAAENAGTRNVRVNLSPAAPSGGLTLGYSVSGTATAGSGNDFTIQGSGSLSVAAGATSATIPVAINDDSSAENAETVILTLTGGSGYTLGSTKVHTLTINDNDGSSPPTTPSASFASASSSAAESAGTRNVRVNLDPAPQSGLTLRYSVTGTATAGSGNDFTIQGSGSLSVAAGDTSATIPVAINDDSTEENAETVILTLTGDTGYTLGSPTVHTLTINDNDRRGTTPPPPPPPPPPRTPDPGETTPDPEITVQGGSAVTEGGDAVFTVSANPAPASALTVTVTVADDENGDFLAQADEGGKTVTIAGGQTFATLTVPTQDDSQDEADGSVTATITGGDGYTLASPSTATVAVSDNDEPPPIIPAITVQGGSAVTEGGDAVFTVSASPAPASALTVTLTVADDANSDFLAQALTDEGRKTVTIAGGQTFATLTVPTQDDSQDEADGSVTATITGGDGYTLASPSTATVAVSDNDEPPPIIPAITVQGGSAVTEGGDAVFTVSANPAPASALTVTLTVADDANSDFLAQADEGGKTVTIAGGQTFATLTVPTQDDSQDEADGSVTATITGGDGYTLASPSTATVAVSDNDEPPPIIPAITVQGGSAVTEGGDAVFTISANPAPASALTVTVTVADDANSDFLAQADEGGKTVTIAGGQTFATLTVPTQDDSQDEADGSVTATITGGDGYTLASPSTATVAVSDNDEPPPIIPVVGIAGGSAVTEGGDAVFTISASPAPASALTVTVTVADDANSDFLAQADEGRKTVTIAGGQTFATLTVPTQDDSQDEADGSVTATITGGDGYTLASPSTATVAVSDNDEPPPIIPVVGIAGGSAVTEGGDAVFTISASPAPASALTVTVTVADDENSDFLAQADEGGKTVTIAGGQTFATLTVPTQDDSQDEADGSVTATITGGDGYTLASPSTATVAVSDNDEPPAPVVTPGAQADPAAWLARFGRMVAGQALDGITGRMAAARRAGFAGNIGGRALGFVPQARPGPGPTAGAGETGAAPESAEVFEGGGPVNAARLSLSDIDRMFGTGRAAGASRTLTGRDLMLGSRFTLTGERDATGGSLAFWGQAAQSGFDGREGRVSLDGKAVTAMLGADYARDRWLAGMALMQSGGKGDSRATAAGAGSGSGDVETTLTAALPYASLQVSERMKLWGALGHGTGEVTLKPELGRTLKSDISWTMAATGLRSEVIPPPEEGSGPALALVSDALWAGTSSDKAHELAASDSDVTRLRLGLEGSWTMALQEGGLVTPKLEAGLRHDDGDAETGFGVELGGGLAWVDPRLGLSLDLSGRMLVTHGADDLEDRGFAASLAFDPDPSTERGLSLALRQERGGQATGGLDALFRADPLRARTGSEKDTRWTAEAAWGFAAFDRRFTGSPHVGLGIATGERDYTLGWRLTPEAGAPDLGFGVTVTRRESDEAAPQHGIGVQLNTRW